MATLALAVAGAAAGSALFPAGVSLLGATLSAASIGAQIGVFAGSYIDNSLFGTSGHKATREGPRLTDLYLTASTEGAAIPRLYGRARLGGQVIWAKDMREEVLTTKSTGAGGKSAALGGGGSGKAIEYRYYGTFAIALAEGPISGIGRVWADGQEIDLSKVNHRVHLGTETQDADPSIVAELGEDLAPAYRGIAYVVFDDIPLANYGNRIPQFSFEVQRALDGVAEEVKAVVLTPGSGEFVYSLQAVDKVLRPGKTESENVHTLQGGSDWSVALDQLEVTLPNAKNVSLIASWFGTDLRAGVCELQPGVEVDEKLTTPLTWKVAGQTRSNAYVVSKIDDMPAYGGTPSDQSVIAAIRDLKSRGISVTLTPFVLMDIAQGNSLPNPYGPGSTQPSHPWRGRITVHPAPGIAGSPDKSASAATQVDAFVGTALTSHYQIAGEEVVYTGPVEWSLRRMVLHYAHLAKAAGGVDAFVIGSELRGLTQVRSAAATYPFVTALIALASDVKDILGANTKVLYAADWSEYFGHQPNDGSGDVFFHLDPLWASSSIDAIGIDVYWPLADWRDGKTHLDFLAGTRSPYNLAYLRSNVQGGEGYDWYYASQSARTQQVRTPITDGSGKPWIYRYKDIKSWWLNSHYNRPGGVENSTPTAWIPQSKPFWFTEIGCPAIDKGANQPNVFVDPKSSESAQPYFSRGTRDDHMQRAFLRAFIQAFDPTSDGYIPDANPISDVNGQRMVDTTRTHVYAWDARPYPAFPYNTSVWGDGENWTLGHWLNGRMASAPLADTVKALLTDQGFQAFDTSALNGSVPGYVLDRIMSARDALQPLELAYFFDSLESEGKIVFRHRGAEPPVFQLTQDDLVEERPGDGLLSLTRSQETDLPASAKISYIDCSGSYRKSVAEARRIAGASTRVAQAEVPIILDFERATEIAESWLFEAWASRERAALKLPPSTLALEPGDVIAIAAGDQTHLIRITEIGDNGTREVEGRIIDPEVYFGVPTKSRPTEGVITGSIGVPLVEFLDLPMLRGTEDENAAYAAAYQEPWSGGVAIYDSPEETGFTLRSVVSASATIGETQSVLMSGNPSVTNNTSRLVVKLDHGALTSASRLQVLGGANAAAVRTPSGAWEVIQFEMATLIAPNTYELGRLMRGQCGTEHAIPVVLPSGSRFIMLGSELATITMSSSELGLSRHWRYGPSSRSIGDASYASREYAFEGLARKPLAPVHIEATRVGGDIQLSWKRRTRIGGDTWEISEVPLSEASEHWEIDILQGNIVKRTLAANQTSVTYLSTQQVADFGSTQASVSLAIYQISASAGRGIGRVVNA